MDETAKKWKSPDQTHIIRRSSYRSLYVLCFLGRLTLVLPMNIFIYFFFYQSTVLEPRSE